MLLLKEISYAFDINIKYKSKPSYSLQDLSIMSINACTTMMKNISQHRLIKNELIKRCSYLELKYKFREEIKSIYEEMLCLHCNYIYNSKNNWWFNAHLFRKLDNLVQINEVHEILNQPAEV
jgi:hypothetical protein